MCSDVAITVSGVTKEFDIFSKPIHRLFHLLVNKKKSGSRFVALSDINFNVAAGESLAIIGRNGAGKSTLLQIVCGTLQPTQGKVNMQGRVAALLELGAGFSAEFTGRENIYMKAAIHGVNKARVDELLPNILEFAEIGEFIDQPVKTYSSGMFVRLAFAVIAHLDADILIVDEALAVGDVFFAQKCIRFLREFCKKGTLLFVSHDTNMVNSLCDKAILLDGGKITMQGDAKQVCDAYLGSFYENRFVQEDAQKMVSADSAPPGVPEFGLGGAKISASKLFDSEGSELTTLDHAQLVTLELTIDVHEPIEAPIAGFFLKDRLGLMLMGDNTVGQLDWSQLEENNQYRISFSFNLPQLATGDYTIGVAVGAGRLEEHVQHHWVHDILSFKSISELDMTGILKLEDFTCDYRKL